MAGLFAIEDEARAGGHLLIAGVDEVGRGCLAGPVYAGAVVFDRRVALPGLDDSKALLPEVRESLASRIREVARGAEVGAATAAEVDAIGIVAATLLAMRRALDLLRGAGHLPSLVLVDAVRVPGLEIAQRAYVRGDGRVAAIAAASIVAKVARDARMDELEARFPMYGFGSHRGYGTPEHLAALRRYGPCPEHRLTFDRVVVRRGAPKAA
ncbi:MAG: ribonuclease HII [Thermoanaerobaculia bacterium]